MADLNRDHDLKNQLIESKQQLLEAQAKIREAEMKNIAQQAGKDILELLSQLKR